LTIMLNTRSLAVTICALLLIAGASGAPPKRNVSASRHPNLAAAQKYSQQAWEKIAAAQRANEFDLGGHAQKAKNLLEDVNKELKLAAEAADRQ
jgi:hypothetical protein